MHPCPCDFTAVFRPELLRLDVVQPRTMSQAAGSTRFFFVIALGFTWLLQLPAVLVQYGMLAGGAEGWVPLAALGGFGPLVAAMLAARRENGRSGIRALFGRLSIR